MVLIGVLQARAGRLPTNSAPGGGVPPATNSTPDGAGPRPALPAPVRHLLEVLALIMLTVGAALLVAPLWAAAWWPWDLTALTGRAVGAWLVGLGSTAAYTRLRGRRNTVGAVGATAVSFVALQLIALIRHGDDLRWTGLPAAGIILVLAVLGVTGIWLLALSGTARAGRPNRPVHQRPKHGRI
ncbi:hypothetical protein [Sanguibacter sp. Z1732]